jgi:hypothetical protein
VTEKSRDSGMVEPYVMSVGESVSV